MTIVTTVPSIRRMTADDFAVWDGPDDGSRYELLDGVVVVSPSPLVPHQDLLGDLHVLLRAAAAPGTKVFVAPLDVRLSDVTVVQPDVVVVRTEDATGPRLTGIPLLAVELLSDSTRGTDLLLKRERYERAGVPSYWIAEPVSREFVVLEIGRDGRYATVHEGVLGRPPVRLDRPFPVTLGLPG
jgi:Uma2 family endonuclease